MTTFDGSNRSPDWDAIARYRAGESDAAESADVERWLASHPADAGLLESLDGVVATHMRDAVPAATNVPVDVDAALVRVHARMDARVAPPRLTLARASTRAVARRRIAWAIGGLAAAAAVALLTFGPMTDSPSVAMSADAAARSRTTAGAHEYRTAVGIIDSVSLTDGTRIILAPGSLLVVPASYGKGSRDVGLIGMAMFTVRHDAAHPFAVRAGAAVMRDVGTRFVVRAPADARLGVTVSVSDGEVSMIAAGAGSAATSLRAGDRAVLQTSGAISARHAAQAGDEAWTNGLLVYRDAPLDVVRDDVRRWYGIELEIPDAALAAKHLTATFERAAPDGALRTLALALGATIERSGTLVTLRPSAPVP